MGRSYPTFLAGPSVFACANCKSHLAHGDQLISRQFHGQHGKAFLFEQVFNIDEGIAADRSMTTGLHTVRDIYCHKCGVTVGWKYDRAYESTQKYKEGRFILEKALLCQAESTNWDMDSLDADFEIIDAGPRPTVL